MTLGGGVVMDIVERLRIRIHTSEDETALTDEAADEIDRLRKENELLQKELKKHLTYQEHRHGRIGTHDPVCYEYGPRHYECALREIERLREALRLERQLKDDALRAFNEARAALKGKKP